MLSAATPRATLAGDGSTTAIAITWPFYAGSDLVVTEKDDATGTETTKTLGVHYSVSGGAGSTGTVTAVAAPAVGKTWIVERLTALAQAADFTSSGNVPAATQEAGLDKLTMMLQDLRQILTRSLRFPAGDATSLSALLPAALARASSYLAFDASGNAVAIAKEIDAALVSAFGATLIDDADASAALSTLGFSAFIKTLIDDADAAAARATLGVPMRAFLAHKNGTNQTAIADGTWTKGTFGTEVLDTEGCYDVATSRFTPAVAGWSLLIGRLAFVNMEDQALMGTSIYKNGATPSYSGVDQRAASGTSGFQGCLAIAILDHDADDYFECWGMWDGTSGTRDFLGAATQTFFGGITFRKN